MLGRLSHCHAGHFKQEAEWVAFIASFDGFSSAHTSQSLSAFDAALPRLIESLDGQKDRLLRGEEIDAQKLLLAVQAVQRTLQSSRQENPLAASLEADWIMVMKALPEIIRKELQIDQGRKPSR